MKMPSRPRLLLVSAALVAAVAVGCSLDVADFTGKGCSVSTDCPQPYSCVETGPDVRTCELIQLPIQKDIVEPVLVEADWCTDVKPMMFRYCVDCHGGALTNATEGSKRTDFHLGYYELPGSSGAKDFGARIDVRMIDKSPTAMPPPTYANQPTEEELAKVKGWVAAGMPFALPGRPDCPDDGVAPTNP